MYTGFNRTHNETYTQLWKIKIIFTYKMYDLFMNV